MPARRARDRASLIDRVLHRLEPGAETERGVGKVGAVADRRNRRVRRPQIFVDHNSIRAFEAARSRERILGDDADADDNHVRAQALAVGEDDRFGALAALDRGDADPEPEPRAEGGVGIQEKIRHDRRDGPPHRPRDLDDRRLGLEAGRGRRDFEADEPRPDDDDLAPRAEPLADRGRIGDVAERKYARQIDARNVEPPLPRAGREDEMPVADRAAVAELDPPRRAIDPRCADPEPQVDALIAKVGFGPERQAVDIHLALQKRLRQRRALIGHILLGREKDHVAVELLLAQAHRRLNPRMAGADDDDRVR